MLHRHLQDLSKEFPLMSKINRHNNRREFLKNAAAAAAGLGFVRFGLKEPPLLAAGLFPPTLPPQDSPRTHNMLVVVQQTVYLSHLLMFDGFTDKRRVEFSSPHRFQVILEATF